MTLKSPIDRRAIILRLPECWYRVSLRLTLQRESGRRFRLQPSFRIARHGGRLAAYRFFENQEKASQAFAIEIKRDYSTNLAPG